MNRDWPALLVAGLGLWVGYQWGKLTMLEHISEMFEEPSLFTEFVEDQREIADLQ